MLRHRSYLLEDSGLSKFLDKHGAKRVPNPHASIAFSEKEQKWYGWSHRTIYGFGVGHHVKDDGNDMPSVMAGETAKTLDDAKKMAIAFSKEVS
jgi:hypothetical protein